MSCLDVSIPILSRESKEKLVADLTEAFVASTGHRAEIFGIRFFEYQFGEVAMGGKICTEDNPYLHFILHTPRMSREKKQLVVKSFSSAYTNCVGKPDWLPTVRIIESPYDNVGIEGQLISDLFEETRNRPFYYPLAEN